MNLWDFIVTIVIIVLGSIGCMIAVVIISGLIVFVILLAVLISITMGIIKGIVYIAELIQGN